MSHDDSRLVGTESRAERQWPENPWQSMATWLFHGALALAALLGVVLVSIGLVEAASGALTFWLSFTGSVAGLPGGSEPAAKALALTLKGLEFVFLAPLPLLVLHTIRDYTWHLTPGRPTSGDERIVAHSRLDEVKSLIISIMVAVIATDMVSRVLGNSPFGYDQAVPRLLAFVALAGYLLLLRKARP
jgi:hypothetical protein